MKCGILVFPGSNCDHDCLHVLKNVLGQEAFFIWHKETDLKDADLIVVPGGFSYGDYLRSGAVAAKSPVMQSVQAFASNAGLVFGICNGFQILQEARLLPGVLMRNKNLKFICKDLYVRVENNNTPFTKQCAAAEVLRIPVAHMDGNFFEQDNVIKQYERKKQIIFRYCNSEGELTETDNLNGSVSAVAGISNEAGNVMGMMPHPERCSESILHNEDGLKIFQSLIRSVM